MPIIKPTANTAPVFYPQTDYTIVKYLDLTKYISLLQRQALFFCRLDKLEDHFEGTTGRANTDVMIKWYKHMRDKKFFQVDMPDEEITETVKQGIEFQKKLKSINCVNCWNKKDDESVALWKIYSDFSKGIMIRSSISRLVNSLENSTEEIHLSEVRYLDYDKEVIPPGNTVAPIFHKQTAYSYEDEVRLIHEVSQSGWIHDWSKEEIQEGIFININISELIDEIIISPFSPKWFLKLVEDLSQKYGFNKPIKKSKLSLIE